MKGSAIRHLASSSRASLVAAAFFERTVQIWNLQTLEQVAQLETVLDFGGRRLLVSPDGKHCVAASWRGGARGGVACYATSGKKLWHRTDLRQTQRIITAGDEQSLWWMPETGRIQRLDMLTGHAVETIRGFRYIFESPYSEVLLLARRRGNYLLRSHSDISIAPIGFSILDAAFGPDTVCLTEAGGPVRCFDLDGHERWRFVRDKGSDALISWYHEGDRSFYGIHWHYERRNPREFIQLDSRTGACKRVVQLKSWEETFCAHAELLVTSSGQLYDLSGTLRGELAFPQTDYPANALA